MNIGEGAGRRGGDRTYHYSVALGSGEETVDALVIVDAFGYADATKVAKVDTLIKRLNSMLWRLIHPRA